MVLYKLLEGWSVVARPEMPNTRASPDLITRGLIP